MSTNNSQIGNTPSEPLINNTENETNIDQLLSVEIVTTSQSSLIQLNPINMIPNIQQHGNILRPQHARRERQQQQYQQRQEWQQQQEEQRQQQQERQRRHRERNQQRYEQWQERVYQREQEEGEHYRYLQRRSPNFDELMDEILQERQMEAYYSERMTPEERQQIWEQEQLNELHGNSVPRAHGLPLDDLERYAKFLQGQKWRDTHDQAMQVYDMQNNDYTQECIRNEELLMQKEEWEDIAFRLQQLQ